VRTAQLPLQRDRGIPLPEATEPGEVFSFYASHLPTGWRITNSDLDCPSRPTGPASQPTAKELASFRALVTSTGKVIGLSVSNLKAGLPTLLFFRGEASLGCAIGPT
jgi:hypothetical protein